MTDHCWNRDAWSRLGFQHADRPLVLYCHRPQIVSQHQSTVASFFAANLPAWQLRFVSSSDEIGEYESAEILIAPAAPWVKDKIARLPNLKWLHFTGSGVDALSADWRPSAGLLMSTSAGVNADAIAEYVLGGLIYLAKCFDVFRMQQENRRWARRWLPELTGRSIVIVGVGRVGQAVCRLTAALGMVATGVAKRVKPVDGFEAVVGLEQLDKVLATATAVVLAVPLTTETRGLFDRLRFSGMPEGCIFINVSRGEVVVEADLADALARGKLRGAVLDVFENEPLPPSSPLWGLPNVLITPHVAGTTDRYVERMLDIFQDNVRQLCESGTLVTSAFFDRAY